VIVIGACLLILEIQLSVKEALRCNARAVERLAASLRVATRASARTKVSRRSGNHRRRSTRERAGEGR
jgi:hypothetical protein